MPRSLTMHDVRLSGFSQLVPLSKAWAWLDQQPAAVMSELSCLAKAAGPVLAEPIVWPAPARPDALGADVPGADVQ
jgi:hypothetical protein